MDCQLHRLKPSCLQLGAVGAAESPRGQGRPPCAAARWAPLSRPQTGRRAMGEEALTQQLWAPRSGAP
eukprot:8592168-Alexandrium_andersonii.AAC.1